MSNESTTRPPDGPWKWPNSWEVLRHCPDALDLINGQLREWTNCAGVIADALEEGGYPILSRSVRGMQGRYAQLPTLEIDIVESVIFLVMNADTAIFTSYYYSPGDLFVYRRLSITKKWERQVLRGHKDSVTGAYLFENGVLVTWGKDATIRIWDQNGDHIVLEGHSRGVKDVQVVSPTKMLSSGNDGVIIIWECIEGRWSSVLLKDHTDPVLGAELLSNGDILSWSYDRTLRLWQCNTQLDWSSIVLDDDAGKLWINPYRTNGQMVSCGYDRSLRIWEMDEFGEWKSERIPGHESIVTKMHFLSAEHFLSWGNDCILWTRHKNGSWNSKAIEQHCDTIVLPDGRHVLGKRPNQYCVWENVQDQGWKSFDLRLRGVSIGSGSLLPDGRLVIWGADKVWLCPCHTNNKWQSIALSNTKSGFKRIKSQKNPRYRDDYVIRDMAIGYDGIILICTGRAIYSWE